jgi:hypothetical protein
LYFVHCEIAFHLNTQTLYPLFVLPFAVLFALCHQKTRELPPKLDLGYLGCNNLHQKILLTYLVRFQINV